MINSSIRTIVGERRIVWSPTAARQDMLVACVKYVCRKCRTWVSWRTGGNWICCRKSNEKIKRHCRCVVISKPRDKPTRATKSNIQDRPFQCVGAVSPASVGIEHHRGSQLVEI